MKAFVILLVLGTIALFGSAQTDTNDTITMNTITMKVEIWSDVMCPFCYIGKRKFEAAMAQFPDSTHVELIWKSFQLDPEAKSVPGQSVYQYLADRKGMNLRQSEQMHDNVANMAREAGLDYHFEKAVIANSFDAHRLAHLAKKHGLGDAMEERLFKAYFTEGADVSDHEVLVRLGKEIGLPEDEIRSVLGSDAYATDVRQDIAEAGQIGVRGVPFFVFDRKYAVSGAQQTAVFLETMEKAFAEWRKANPASNLQVTDGAVCTPDGECK